MDSNILIIVIDALRPQNMPIYGYSYNTAPNISHLKNDFILFDNAFSTTNVTDSSLTSIYSGLYPINHGIRSHGFKITSNDLRKVSYVTFIQEYLLKRGYNTFAFDFLERWHRRGFKEYIVTYKSKETRAFIQRIARFIMQRNLLSSRTISRFKRISGKLSKRFNAEEVTYGVIKYLKKIRHKNFFGFIHYWDTHIPYFAPPDIAKLFSSNHYECNYNIKDVTYRIRNKEGRMYIKSVLEEVGGVKELISLYDAAIRYVDENIGILLDFLKDFKIYDDTIIVLTSDHGESLIEHGIFFDHHGLYNTTIKVPLLIKLPFNNCSGIRIKYLVQHIDIVPTLLDLLGFPIKRLNLDGKTLLPFLTQKRTNINVIHSLLLFEENYVERKKAIIFIEKNKMYKFIYSKSKRDALCRYCGRIHGGVEELYNLSKDEEEIENLIQISNEKNIDYLYIKNLRDHAIKLLNTTLNSISLRYRIGLMKKKIKKFR